MTMTASDEGMLIQIALKATSKAQQRVFCSVGASFKSLEERRKTGRNRNTLRSDPRR
jgi:hypothetical protein